MAEHGGERDFRIVGMDGDGTDLSGVPKPDVFPALAGVRRAVDAVTHRDVPARTHGPGAHIDHIPIGGGDGDGAHRAHPEEAIADIRPVVAGVAGLEHPAAGAAEVIGQRIAGHPGRRGGAPAAGETDRSELHALVVLGRHGDIRFVEVLVVVAMAALSERPRGRQHTGEGSGGQQDHEMSDIHEGPPESKETH